MRRHQPGEGFWGRVLGRQMERADAVPDSGPRTGLGILSARGWGGSNKNVSSKRRRGKVLRRKMKAGTKGEMAGGRVRRGGREGFSKGPGFT